MVNLSYFKNHYSTFAFSIPSQRTSFVNVKSNLNSNLNSKSNSKSNSNLNSNLNRIQRKRNQMNCCVTRTSIQTISSTMEEDVDTASSKSSSPSSSASAAALNLGQWEEIHGNYVLRPQSTTATTSNSNNNLDSLDNQNFKPPRALVHFLGGAIVGAAPDITYRYILEKLAQNGFLIVSTPYTLSFDYITTCDDIITRFERIAPSLAKQYGPIPVIGVGHSCGSLLHLLITTLFPDTPRAANVLISYNNKNVKDAVPLFDEVVAPLFVQLGQSGNETTRSMLEPFMDYPSSSVEVLNLSLDLGRTFLQGMPMGNILYCTLYIVVYIVHCTGIIFYTTLYNLFVLYVIRFRFTFLTTLLSLFLQLYLTTHSHTHTTRNI